MEVLFRRIIVIFIYILLGVHAYEVTSIPVQNQMGQHGSVRPLEKLLGYPKSLNMRTPANVRQNAPYFINQYIYCDNLDQHIASKIKSCIFSTGKQTQQFDVQEEKFTDFSGLTPDQNSFALDSYKPEGYIGDKEIHILHLPNDKPHNFDDIKLHLSLLNAHSTPDVPEIDLDFNKHLGNFEVNFASIKPPRLDSSLIPTTTSVIKGLVRPLIQDHLNAPIFTKMNELQQHGSGGFLEIPHIEKHPLELDSGKSSYDTPGAVDSYGDPIWPSTPSSQNFDSSLSYKKSNQVNLAHLVPDYFPGRNPGYSSTDPADSYGNIANSQGHLGGNENIFFKPEYYFNDLRRQEVGATSSESTKISIDSEAKHPNHRYN